MKIKRKFSFFRKISFLLALLLFMSGAILVGQSVGQDKRTCPKIDKSKNRKKAKELKTERFKEALSVSKYSYEHGESIPNYM